MNNLLRRISCILFIVFSFSIGITNTQARPSLRDVKEAGKDSMKRNYTFTTDYTDLNWIPKSIPVSRIHFKIPEDWSLNYEEHTLETSAIRDETQEIDRLHIFTNPNEAKSNLPIELGIFHTGLNDKQAIEVYSKITQKTDNIDYYNKEKNQPTYEYSLRESISNKELSLSDSVHNELINRIDDRHMKFLLLDDNYNDYKGMPSHTFTYDYNKIYSRDGMLIKKDIIFGDSENLYIAYFISDPTFFERDKHLFETFIDSIILPKVSENVDSENVNISDDNTEIFSDIKNNHSHSSAISWAKENGILSGYPDGTFKPNATVNRAEFLKIVLEASNIDCSNYTGESDFKDVKKNSWYEKYVICAKDNEIIEGYSDGTFRPTQVVNYAEALKIAYQTLNVETEEAESNKPWFQRYLNHSKQRNILFNANVDIGSNMERKSVVWIVWKLKQELQK